jgi:SAM-dependent methyltransferase
MSRVTDQDWELLGRREPYWAVITDNAYRGARPNDDVLEKFFAGGEQYIDWLFGQLRAQFGEEFAPASAVDFGCGVGRLVLPLARRCGSVVGVDVSEAMLAEARRNCEARGLDNVSLVKGDDDLSGVEGSFDFVHSFIVFQHIPPDRGLRLFERLLGLLREGGVGALHLTYSREGYAGHREGAWPSRGRFSPVALRDAALRAVLSLSSWGQKRVGLAPNMEMNCYALNPLFHLLQEAGARRMQVQLTKHGVCYGVLLIFRKESATAPYPV